MNLFFISIFNISSILNLKKINAQSTEKIKLYKNKKEKSMHELIKIIIFLYIILQVLSRKKSRINGNW